MASLAKIVAGVCILATLAQTSAADVGPALLECRSIGDNEDRLACYDGAVAELGENQVVTADVATAPEAETNTQIAAAEPLTAEEAFGRDDLETVKKEKAKKAKKNSTLTATAIDIATNKRGKYVFILENGQVWRQLQADTDKLRVPRDASGIGVIIRRKALGAHSLRLSDSKRTVRVERIK